VIDVVQKSCNIYKTQQLLKLMRMSFIFVDRLLTDNSISIIDDRAFAKLYLVKLWVCSSCRLASVSYTCSEMAMQLAYQDTRIELMTPAFYRVNTEGQLVRVVDDTL